MISCMYQARFSVPNNRDKLWLTEAEEEFIQDYHVACKISEKVGEPDMGKGKIKEDWVGARTVEIHGTKEHSETSSPTTEHLAATTNPAP